MTHHEHPNVLLVREGFEALDRGDVQWMSDHLADDAIWHVGGKSKLSGEYQGKGAILEMFGRPMQLGTPRADIHEVLGNDDHVIVIGKAALDDPAGGTIEWLYANVFHIEDGKVKEAWGLADETSAWDALVDRLVG
jgi:ketosteroid isomerase-like protein